MRTDARDRPATATTCTAANAPPATLLTRRLQIDTPRRRHFSMRDIIQLLASPAVRELRRTGTRRVPPAGRHLHRTPALAAMAPPSELGAATRRYRHADAAVRQPTASRASGARAGGCQHRRHEPRKHLADASAFIRSPRTTAWRNRRVGRSRVRDSVSLAAHKRWRDEGGRLIADDSALARGSTARGSHRRRRADPHTAACRRARTVADLRRRLAHPAARVITEPTRAEPADGRIYGPAVRVLQPRLGAARVSRHCCCAGLFALHRLPFN